MTIRAAVYRQLMFGTEHASVLQTASPFPALSKVELVRAARISEHEGLAHFVPWFLPAPADALRAKFVTRRGQRSPDTAATVKRPPRQRETPARSQRDQTPSPRH